MTASVLGGYDDYLSPSGATGGQLPSENAQSGWTSVVDTELDYFYGRSARFFSVDGRAFSNAYTGFSAGPTFGGDVLLTGSTELGSRNTFTFRQGLAYVPSLVMGSDPYDGDILDPAFTPDVASGVLEQRSRSSTSELRVGRNWTTRQTTSVSAAYERLTYLDNLGHNTVTTEGSVLHTWNLTRVVGLTGSYRYSDAQLSGAQNNDDTGVVPLLQHIVEGGLTYSRRLSPTRSIRLSGSIGATRADTINGLTRVPLEYWTPSGQLSVAMDLGRTWMLNGNYSRSINVLQGVSLESFATNQATVVATGTLSRRIEVATGVNLSDGRTGGVENNPGTFAVYGGMAQFRYAFARCCAASLNYDYYYYKLDSVSVIPTGLPPQYDRNAVMVGVTFWLPLYGSSDRGRDAQVR